MAEQWHGMPVALGSIPGGSTFLSCSFAISEVFGHNGMIQRSLIRPGLIGLRTKIIEVSTIGLPAVIPLRFSMISSDIVCISSDENIVPPLPKKTLADFSVITNQSQVVQKISDSYCRCTAASRPARASQNPKTTITSSPSRKRKAAYSSYTLRQISYRY